MDVANYQFGRYAEIELTQKHENLNLISYV